MYMYTVMTNQMWNRC